MSYGLRAKSPSNLQNKMDAIFQPGACWLVIVDNRCTVLRIQPGGNKCQLPGESGEHSFDRVQEWLGTVWTPAMFQCARCLTGVAEKLQPDNLTNFRNSFPSATGSPRPQSFWIASVNGNPDVLQVVENGIRLPGCRETYPLEQVRGWIMQVWSPEMAYCPGCGQAKPSRDMLFFFRNSFKGVCKDCSEYFGFDTAPKTDRV